jgi:hypothetical protein
MSNVLTLSIVNYYSESITLPRDLDGGVVAAGATKVIPFNYDRLMEDDQNVLKPFVAALKNLVQQSQGNVEAEDTGVVSAGDVVYNLVAAKKRIIPNTLVVTLVDGSGDPIYLKDNGAGALAEVGGSGTGTVNYLTGAIVVTDNLTTTPGSGDAILISYAKQEIGFSFAASPRVNAAYGAPAQDIEGMMAAVAAQSGAGIRKGFVTLAAAATAAVVLDPPAPDANYIVLATPEFAPANTEPPYVVSKTPAGFTVRFATNQTGRVNWIVVQ